LRPLAQADVLCPGVRCFSDWNVVLWISPAAICVVRCVRSPCSDVVQSGAQSARGARWTIRGMRHWPLRGRSALRLHLGPGGRYHDPGHVAGELLWLLHATWMIAVLILTITGLISRSHGTIRWIIVGVLVYSVVSMPWTLLVILRMRWNAPEAERRNRELLGRTAES
jgi:hypothetical protein